MPRSKWAIMELDGEDKIERERSQWKYKLEFNVRDWRKSYPISTFVIEELPPDTEEDDPFDEVLTGVSEPVRRRRRVTTMDSDTVTVEEGLVRDEGVQERFDRLVARMFDEREAPIPTLEPALRWVSSLFNPVRQSPLWTAEMQENLEQDIGGMNPVIETREEPNMELVRRDSIDYL